MKLSYQEWYPGNGTLSTHSLQVGPRGWKGKRQHTLLLKEYIEFVESSCDKISFTILVIDDIVVITIGFPPQE